MYPQGVCRIRKPAYAGNGCAIFLVFQTEEVGQKDGCGSQTQLRGVALKDKGPSTEVFWASMPRSCRLFYFVLTKKPTQTCALHSVRLCYNGRIPEKGAAIWLRFD